MSFERFIQEKKYVWPEIILLNFAPVVAEMILIDLLIAFSPGSEVENS